METSGELLRMWEHNNELLESRGISIQLSDYLLPGIILLFRAEFLYPLYVAVILLYYNTTIRIPNITQDFPSRFFWPSPSTYKDGMEAAKFHPSLSHAVRRIPPAAMRKVGFAFPACLIDPFYN